MILSCLLGLVRNSKDLPSAFKVYDSIRRPRANKVVETSRTCGELYVLSDEECGADRQKVVDNLNERWLWIWEHDLDADVQRAKTDFVALTADGHDSAMEA